MSALSYESPDLPQLARSLHATHGFTPAQLRHRVPFLDLEYNPHISVDTIQGWLLEAVRSPDIERSGPLNVQEDDNRQLRSRVSILEATIQRQAAEIAEARAARSTASSRTPSPVDHSMNGRSRSSSPKTERPDRDDLRAKVDQLMLMNSQLASQLAAASSPTALAAAVAAAVVDAVDRRGPAAPAPPPAPKPFKDWIPLVAPFVGDGPVTPEAFLAQYRLQARQNKVPTEERPRQLSAKLTGTALSWYTLTFSRNPEVATEAQLSLGLRKAFGQEYAGARALRAIYHVLAQPTQGGAQRLMALDQKEEQARQHRVPYNAGPCEERFCRVLALFTDEEVNSFLSELTADPRCSEEALRQLEESTDSPEDPGAGHDSSFCLSSQAREALFAMRVGLAEAALRRIQPRPPGHTRARLARTEGTTTQEPTQPPPAAAAGAAAPTPPPPAGTPTSTDTAQCLRLTTERLAFEQGRGFKGPPHFFGDNTDRACKERNRVEYDRRRQNGFCFKCTPGDLQQVPFLDCPLHGARAVPSNPPAASVKRSRA